MVAFLLRRASDANQHRSGEPPVQGFSPVASGLRHHGFDATVRPDLVKGHDDDRCASCLDHRWVGKSPHSIDEVFDECATFLVGRSLPEDCEIELVEHLGEPIQALRTEERL